MRIRFLLDVQKNLIEPLDHQQHVMDWVEASMWACFGLHQNMTPLNKMTSHKIANKNKSMPLLVIAHFNPMRLNGIPLNFWGT